MNSLTRGREAFWEEAQELLADLEHALLAWESQLTDVELINRIFRAMHTIKGSSAMFGFDEIADFTHGVESALDRVRSGRLPASEALVELTLRARDQIAVMLNEGAAAAQDVEELRAAFARLTADDAPAAGATATATGTQPESAAAAPSASDGQPPPDPAEPPAERATYRVHFRPGSDLLLRGVDLIALLSELCALGETDVTPHVEDVPPLAEIVPERCYLHWDVRLTTDRGLNAIRDVFIFVEDDSELSIEQESPSPAVADVAPAGTPSPGDAGPVVPIKPQDEAIPAAAAWPEPNSAVSAPQEDAVAGTRPGATPAAGNLPTEAVPPATPAAVQTAQTARPERPPAPHRASAPVGDGRETHDQPLQSSIRVPSERLDALVDLVGELVTVQARLSQTSASRADPELSALSEEVERLTGELRDSTMTIRMVPIDTLFSRFKRVVHDLSRELGRDVEMVLSGTQTELDKTVIERLNNPLVHLIRNSLDHGIEPPERRVAAGKPARGLLQISAEHSGARVLIRVRDDGAGIDAERVRAKAVEQGLIAPDARLSQSETVELIFAPGFSTAHEVTDISGRGVGLDVVKRSIEALRGTLEVQSERGRGTQITIELPLTLAIIDGLLVAVGEQHYIVPLSMVEECVVLGPQDRLAAAGRRTVTVREQMVPFASLRERFGIEGKAPDTEQVVIGSVGGTRFGLVVDRVVGNHQTVIKPLSKIFRNVTDISGATILGDGTVALIVDLAHTHQSALDQATNRAVTAA